MEPLDTLIAYTNDAWAVERTMRFFQASFWAASLIGPSTYVIQAGHSKAQIHLARRFFRVFKWVECWKAVFTAPETDYGAVHENVRMLKDSSLGMYFFLDMMVLPTALGAVDGSVMDAFVEDMTGVKGGGSVIEHTAAVCWFYAILLSIVLALLELGSPPPAPKKAVSEKGEKKGSSKKGAKKEAAAAPPVAKAKPRSAVLQSLLTNSLDILIPATGVGYMSLDPIYVALAMATGSLITMASIWRKIYAEKEAAPDF